MKNSLSLLLLGCNSFRRGIKIHSDCFLHWQILNNILNCQRQFDLWRHSEVAMRKADGFLCFEAISVLARKSDFRCLQSVRNFVGRKCRIFILPCFCIMVIRWIFYCVNIFMNSTYHDSWANSARRYERIRVQWLFNYTRMSVRMLFLEKKPTLVASLWR